MNNNILSTLSYGMYAIGVNGEKGPSACIANTVFQVTAEPIYVAVSISLDNYTNKCIKETGLFSVSVLSEDTSGTIIGALGFNSGKDIDKLKNIRHKILNEGIPVLKEHSCCWFLCKVVDSIQAKTHTVFISEVLSGSDKYRFSPMTYAYYHDIIKGSAPKNAPTYRSDEYCYKAKPKYVCSICGYVYNSPYEEFENLEDDWSCPICKAPKSVFKLKKES